MRKSIRHSTKKLLYIFSFIILSLFSCNKSSQINTKEKQTLFRVSLGSDIVDTNPQMLADNPSAIVAVNSFEGLFRINRETGSAEKGVVREYSLSEDGLTYTFKLRDDSFFSDHTPVTAQVFVDSWQRALTPSTASPTAYMLAEVIKNGEDILKGKLPPSQLDVKAIDDFTLEVHLAFKAPYLFEILALPVSSPLPTHIIREKGENWNRSFPIVSNGPFFMSEWKPSSQVTLLKNPFYYQASQVAIDKIIFYSTDDLNTAYNMYLNGEVDYLAIVPVDHINEVLLRDDFHISSFVNSYYYLLNMKRKPFDDIRIRRALSLAIDRNTLSQKVITGSLAKPLRAAIYKMPGYPSQEYFKDDLVEAKRLLAEAGYPDGKGFPKLSITYNTNEEHKKIAEFIQQEWNRNLNIKVTLRNEEWKSFLSTRSSLSYDILRMSWLPDYQDPIAVLNFFSSNTRQTNYNNPLYDDALKATNLLSNQSTRMKALAEVEKMLMKDSPFIPILTKQNLGLIDTKNKWDGWSFNLTGDTIFKDIKPKTIKP